MNFLGLGIVVWITLAWITHIAACIQTSSWLFMLAGAIFFPIAWVHGTGLWLGFF